MIQHLDEQHFMSVFGPKAFIGLTTTVLDLIKKSDQYKSSRTHVYFHCVMDVEVEGNMMYMLVEADLAKIAPGMDSMEIVRIILSDDKMNDEFLDRHNTIKRAQKDHIRPS